MHQSEPQVSLRCNNCGFTLQAAKAPDICPMCRGQGKFKEVIVLRPEEQESKEP
jgi:rubrerythrin